MTVQLILLAIFFAVTIGVGVVCRRSVKDVGNFVLGGREVGPWVTAFAYGTSYFSAVVFIGYAGQFGWSYGISAVWIGIGNAFLGSLLAWVVLGKRTRVMTKHLESATMPDFFAKRYKSQSLKLIASIIIFIFLVPYSASVYRGLSGLFSMAFGIDFIYCAIAMAVLTAIYVIAGGYMAAALNDLIQGVIMLVGICAVIFAVLQTKGGLMPAIAELSQVESETLPELNGAFVSILGPDPIGLLSVVVLTSLGTWGLPQMIHKFYTIKNERAIKTGTVISTVFAVVVAGGSYFLGGFGRIFYTPESTPFNFDEIIPTMLGDTLPDLLMGVVIVLVLSASMSTLSSLVIASSATFVSDFLKGRFIKDMVPKQELLLVRVLCGAFILLSVVIALNPNTLISSLMSLSWGTLAGCFLGPFLFGLFWKKTTTAAIWVSFVAGVGINVWNLLLPFTSSITAGAVSMIASVALVPLVSLLTKKLPTKDVDQMFACYEERVSVPHRVALDEVSE